ncbi:hypothetical protein CEXT_233061 [Caerostris extrusa]|uniref:Uncharacterized protein n=1 Tax=Caerostris extrusa TaxID=172846 RepID=A0AAV4XSJ7_CAEEX|nr:hypothetical protein CEXT_233061 [Caerostris extrusa]
MHVIISFERGGFSAPISFKEEIHPFPRVACQRLEKQQKQFPPVRDKTTGAEIGASKTIFFLFLLTNRCSPPILLLADIGNRRLERKRFPLPPIPFLPFQPSLFRMHRSRRGRKWFFGTGSCRSWAY